MTIDERLDRLVERHEALAESVEFLAAANREIAELTRQNSENIAKLIEVSNRDAEDIRALARIAELHDRRLTRLEDETP
jgi:hypothetical protein